METKKITVNIPANLYNAMEKCGFITKSNTTEIIKSAVLDYCARIALEQEGGKVIYIDNPQSKAEAEGAELETEVMRLRMAFNKLEIENKLGGAYGIDTITAFLIERLITDGIKEKTLFKLHKETNSAAIVEDIKKYYSELGINAEQNESGDNSEN